MSKQPNFLIFMVDELCGRFFEDGPAPFLHVPNLRALSDKAVNFSNTYCPSPLCTPSRASFMTGQLTSKIGAYDNAAELCSSVPTFAHYLRGGGYQTTLSGKMHFIGADQLHGFEQRLTTDIYPVDFGWTPDWTRPHERIDWWYHNFSTVTGAGVAETTNQLEYDDDVTHFTKQKIRDLARGKDERPFCLTVSFTHPHDPFVTRQKYWDLYPEDKMPGLNVAAIDFEHMDAHSKRLMNMSDWTSYDITKQNVIDSRRAYFANISYLDEQIGQILETLKNCQLDEDTIIIFLSDHGDMLGERGLWFKMSMFEDSLRVPMFIHAPEHFKPAKINTPVSTLDVLPTLLDLAGIEFESDIDGHSLVPLSSGGERTEPVFSEYAGEGSIAPMVMIRTETKKFVHCPVDPPQLFNLEDDPFEQVNLATEQTIAPFMQIVEQKWNMATYDADVRKSQADRLIIYHALRQGTYTSWDYAPPQQADERYMRNHLDLNVLEANARFPRVKK